MVVTSSALFKRMPRSHREKLPLRAERRCPRSAEARHGNCVGFYDTLGPDARVGARKAGKKGRVPCRKVPTMK
jgi:hypothetical protein